MTESPPTTPTAHPPQDASTPEKTSGTTSGGANHRVQLDAYAGPMDLLLYLVKRHEIDLQDIAMAELVEQYLGHLRVIETVDVDKAGEFLVMAATLVEIKSQMLVPRPAEEDDDENADHPDANPDIDPRFELVQQLLAYKRFKDAANHLEARAHEWETRFPVQARPAPGRSPGTAAGAEPDATDAPPIELDLEDVNILDLCAAFGRIMDSIGHLGDHQVTYDDTPISLHADDIVDRIGRDGGDTGRMTLPQLFQGRSRSEMIGLFLATLELVRQRKVKVTQNHDAQGEIALELQPESLWESETALEPETSPDWRDPDTGQVQYDWPDEATRQRAQRREAFRKKWGKEAQDADDSADSSSTCLATDKHTQQGEDGTNPAEQVDESQDVRDTDPAHQDLETHRAPPPD